MVKKKSKNSSKDDEVLSSTVPGSAVLSPTATDVKQLNPAFTGRPSSTMNVDNIQQFLSQQTDSNEIVSNTVKNDPPEKPVSKNPAVQSTVISGTESKMSMAIDNVTNRVAVDPETVFNFEPEEPETAKCPSCQSKSVSYNQYTFKINRHQQLTDVTDHTKHNRGIHSNLYGSRDERQASFETFKKTLSNQVLSKVRSQAEYEGIVKNCSLNEHWKESSHSSHSMNSYSFMKNDSPQEILKMISSLCDRVHDIVTKELRVLSVSSPVIVFGDIHGNLKDLLWYEKLFMLPGVRLVGDSFLFLGDYVDRGKHSLEVVMFLFAMKIQSPSSFFLLRGNHEVSGVNKSFRFEKELKQKFPGSNTGEIIYQKIQGIFDCLPIAAVIDDSIFCCHGGPPAPLNPEDKFMSIKELRRSCPYPLVIPQDMYPPAHQVLWNDPIKDKEFKDAIKISSSIHGFIDNVKRGTAKSYSYEAVKNFLTGNGLKFVLRAHEVCPQGFTIDHRGLTTTIFSSSRYDGTNDSAVALIRRGLMTLAKIQTDVYDFKDVDRPTPQTNK